MYPTSTKNNFDQSSPEQGTTPPKALSCLQFLKNNPNFAVIQCSACDLFENEYKLFPPKEKNLKFPHLEDMYAFV